jgi:hypothetical protein
VKGWVSPIRTVTLTWLEEFCASSLLRRVEEARPRQLDSKDYAGGYLDVTAIVGRRGGLEEKMVTN